MRENCLSIRMMAEVCPKYSLSLQNNIEKKVIETIETMKVNYHDVSEWINGMRLKNLESYQILEDKIKNKSSLLISKESLL